MFLAALRCITGAGLLCHDQHAVEQHIPLVISQVLRCMDHATGQAVAVKIIRNKKRFQKQAAIEANILNVLQEQVCHSQQACLHHTQFECLYLEYH
jgi:hypothetical protein